MKVEWMRRRSFTAWNAICLIAFACGGCSNGLSSVGGTVTLDGKPLQAGGEVNGTVTFQPASGQGTIGYASIDQNGRFQVASGAQSGLLPGEYVVTCQVLQMIPPSQPGHPPTPKSITPKRYASTADSGFRFTVEPGANEFELAMTSVAAR
jgi:hypothetical protein